MTRQTLGRHLVFNRTLFQMLCEGKGGDEVEISEPGRMTRGATKKGRIARVSRVLNFMDMWPLDDVDGMPSRLSLEEANDEQWQFEPLVYSTD